jgi:hypothetical protein
MMKSRVQAKLNAKDLAQNRSLRFAKILKFMQLVYCCNNKLKKERKKIKHTESYTLCSVECEELSGESESSILITTAGCFDRQW